MSVAQNNGFSLAEELLAVDAFWERDGQISLRMWPLRGYPCSSRWPYAYTHAGKTR